MTAQLSNNGQAVKTKSAFKQSCGVATNIQAPVGKIWGLLTNAADFPRWNSQVESIDGQIAVGQKITLRVPYSDRDFNLKVDKTDANKEMVWSDGMAPMFRGVRTYTLAPVADGSTDFQMVEVIAGLMLPMIAPSLPDFGPPFESYAADLKAEAERES